MTTYLAFIDAEAECSGCTRPVPRGLAGLTDEILQPKLTPVCEACLSSLDVRLWRALILQRTLDIALRLINRDEDLDQLSKELLEVCRIILTCLPQLTDPRPGNP